MSDTEVYKNDDDGFIFVISNIFENSDNLPDLLDEDQNGDSYVNSKGGKIYNFKGIKHIPISLSNNNIVEFIWDELKDNLDENYPFNIAIINKFDKGILPATDYRYIKELNEKSYIMILNVGYHMDVSFTPRSTNAGDDFQVPLYIGDLIVMGPVSDLLSNFNYEFVLDNTGSQASIINFLDINEAPKEVKISAKKIPKKGRKGKLDKSLKIPAKTKIPKFRATKSNVPAMRASISKKPTLKTREKLNINYTNVVTIPPLNDFEYTKVLGERAKNIENNYKLLIDPGNEHKPINIAAMELEAAKTDPKVKEALSYLKLERTINGEKVLVPVGDLL